MIELIIIIMKTVYLLTFQYLLYMNQIWEDTFDNSEIEEIWQKYTTIRTLQTAALLLYFIKLFQKLKVYKMFNTITIFKYFFNF